MSRHWDDTLVHSRTKGAVNKNHKYVAKVKTAAGMMYFYDMNAYNAYLKNIGAAPASNDKKEIDKKKTKATKTSVSTKKQRAAKLKRGRKLANRAMAGRYGTGAKRKKKLGKDYEYVQNIVNQRMLGEKRAAEIAKQNNWKNVN